MIPAFYIFIAMVVIGIILYIHDRLTNKPSENSAQEAEPQQQEECSDDCCTTHDVCPSEMLLKHMNQPVVYYEELSEGTVAKMISEETEAEPLVLYSVHNADTSKDTYVSLMEENYKNLEKGLN